MTTPTQAPATDAGAPNVTKWELTTNPLLVRRMGKTGEECAELLAVTTRIGIQGIDEIDPGTGKVNRQRLLEEIGDVYAQLDANVAMLGLDDAFIQARRARKLGYMREWEALYLPALASQAPTQPSGDAGAGAVPKGCKLVPLEPTHAQAKAAADAWFDCGSKLFLNKALAALRAGIAASPLPQVREQAALPCACGLSKEACRVTRCCDAITHEQATTPVVSEALKAALPVLCHYASSNPRWWHSKDKCWQDPNGVHAAVQMVLAALTQGTSQAAAPNLWTLCVFDGPAPAPYLSWQDWCASPVKSGAHLRSCQSVALQEHADLGQEMGEYGGLSDERWWPISAAQEGVLMLVFWREDGEGPESERYDFDLLEDEVWQKHADRHEDYIMIGGSMMGPGPSERPPYTHCMPLVAPGQPHAILAEAGITQEKTNG